MKFWTLLAAAHAVNENCFWSLTCGRILQLAAEEIARRNGHTEVELTDWQQAKSEVVGEGPRRN